MDSPEYRKLMCLMWDLVDKRLDAASAAELEDLLQSDPAARKVYAQFLGLTSTLRSTYSLGTEESVFQGVVSDEDLPVTGNKPASLWESIVAGRGFADRKLVQENRGQKLSVPRGSNHRSPVQNWSLASSILAVAAVFYGAFALLSVGLRPEGVWHDTPAPVVTTSPAVAFLTDGEHAVWADGSAVFGARGALAPGEKLELARGWAAITFGTGARVDLQGPATLIVDDKSKATLTDGKLTAKVPQEAIGFAVQTPSLLVVDLGTVFGVEVSKETSDQVHVFKGQVELKFCSPGSTVERQKAVRLHAGQALQIDRAQLTSTPIATDSRRFLAAPEQPVEIDLPIQDAYVTAIKASRPIAYWRFEEVIENRYIRNEMNSEWPAILNGAVRIGGPWGYRRAIFANNDNPQFLNVDSPMTGLRDECSIELFVQPEDYHEGELVSLVHSTLTSPTGSAFASFGAIELMPAENELFPGRTIRLLHRNPPGVADGTNAVSPGPYQTGKWQHVVATRGKSKICLYVDGTLVDSKSFTPEPVMIDPRIVIGRLYLDGEADPVQLEPRQFRGQIDELSIYGRELTAGEVRRHYDASVVSDAGSEQ